jgi:hypothetical protein
MLASAIPPSFPLPFAGGAGGAYIRTIPLASQIGVQAGAASLTDGFPPLVFTPVSAGGTYMYGQDLNGIFNEITASVQWTQAGGFPTYNSAFSAAIGGYPNGAILQSLSKTHLWISSADNNTTNPDAGGANWINWVSGTAYQYPIPIFLPYGVTPAVPSFVGDTGVAQFGKTAAAALTWSFQSVISLDITKPVRLRITYTGDVNVGNFYIQLGYQDTSSGSLAPSYTNTLEAIPAPALVSQEQQYLTTTAIIPANTMTTQDWVNCVFTRLATNVLDTNAGNLQIINITQEQ